MMASFICNTRTAARSAARSRNCGIHGPEAALVWAAELFWAAISFLGWTVTCVMLCEASQLADGDGTEAVSRSGKPKEKAVLFSFRRRSSGRGVAPRLTTVRRWPAFLLCIVAICVGNLTLNLYYAVLYFL